VPEKHSFPFQTNHDKYVIPSGAKAQSRLDRRERPRGEGGKPPISNKGHTHYVCSNKLPQATWGFGKWLSAIASAERWVFVGISEISVTLFVDGRFLDCALAPLGMTHFNTLGKLEKFHPRKSFYENYGS
jgi:hypothetical protein